MQISLITRWPIHSWPTLIWPLMLHLLLAGCDTGPRLQPLSEDAVILAFGDSLTHGTGAGPEQAYPARLQSLLSRTVINAGVPGEVTRNALTRLPGLLDRHQPELLILCHGGNDILRRNNLQRTRQNLQHMIDLASARDIQVVLVGVPEFGLFLNTASFYHELAEANGVPIEADVLADILGNNTLKADQIHPNSKGYQYLADQLHYLLQTRGAI